MVRSYKVPRVSGAPNRPQMVALEDWASSLRGGQVVAFAVDPEDVHIEGPFWLAKLLDVAFQAPAAMTHASDLFEEGWFIVRAQWSGSPAPPLTTSVYISTMSFITMNVSLVM